MSDRLWKQLRRITRWMTNLAVLAPLVPWQMRLEVLMTAIPPTARQLVAENLQLPQTSIDRLAGLAAAESAVLAQLSQDDRPSQIVHLLQPYDLETLVLIAVRHPHQGGDRIWRYLTQWSSVKAPLNGNDLKQLGYRQGPQFRAMLDELLSATLDGIVQDRETAIAFMTRHYSPPPTPPSG